MSAFEFGKHNLHVLKDLFVIAIHFPFFFSLEFLKIHK